MGKPWLKNVKAGYRNADSFTEFLTAMFGLIQVGLRHKGLREEVCKTLLSERPEAAWFWGLREYRDALVPLVRTVFDERAGQHDAQHLRDGRFWVGEYSKVNPALAARFPDAGSVPEEIARPAHLRFFFDTRANFVEMVAVGIKLQPWLARASLSDLYLPEEIVSIWQQAPSRKDLQDMGLSYYHAPLQKPVRKEKAPGRNDPCPCGSKKKYKKCCGSPEAAERAKAVEVRNGG
ncbi:MAG: SEC-C domain-containing protein [Deltaproteobacteria bacterium]|nr:SEC-C domain-containing protein [Deltaproteobacteria bacterium]